MLHSQLKLFQAPQTPEPLVFKGERIGDKLVNGLILTAGAEPLMAGVPAGLIADGVAFFREPGDYRGKGWSDEGIQELLAHNWVEKNWHIEFDQAEENPMRKRFATALAAVNGPVLEVAAGPGGGNLSPILHRNPQAQLIVNEWSYRIMRLWREFLLKEGEHPNVCFAVFDACRMPIRDATVAAISSNAGFSNIERPAEAIKEAYRVLQPGGKMYCMEQALEADHPEALPREIACVLSFRFGAVCAQTGFIVVTEELGDRRRLAEEESGMAEKAAQYGVTVHATSRWYELWKPVRNSEEKGH